MKKTKKTKKVVKAKAPKASKLKVTKGKKLKSDGDGVFKVAKGKKIKSGYRELKDGSYSIYGWHVVNTPNEKFPTLVSISHKKKDIQKRFITIHHAIKFIENAESERLILNHDSHIVRELKSLGLGILGAAPVKDDTEPAPVENAVSYNWTIPK